VWVLVELFTVNKNIFFTYDLVFYFKIVSFLIISVFNVISDLKSHRVYSKIMIVMSAIWVVISFFSGLYVMFSVISGVIMMIFVFSLIIYFSKGGMGLGDMFYLVLFASMFGLFYSTLAFLFSFWSATLLIIVPYMSGKIDKKIKLPFGPFIFIGCVGALVVGWAV